MINKCRNEKSDSEHAGQGVRSRRPDLELLKENIANGNYHVSSEKIAEKMLSKCVFPRGRDG